MSNVGLQHIFQEALKCTKSYFSTISQGGTKFVTSYLFIKRALLSGMNLLVDEQILYNMTSNAKGG